MDFGSTTPSDPIFALIRDSLSLLGLPSTRCKSSKHMNVKFQGVLYLRDFANANPFIQKQGHTQEQHSYTSENCVGALLPNQAWFMI